MIWAFNRKFFLSTSALLAALLTAPAFGASIGIVNGDFETDGVDNAAPPSGWTDNSSSTSFWTGVPDEGGNLSSGDATAAGFSGFFLTTARTSAGAGSQPSTGQLVQTVDLSPFGTDIDNGDQQLFVDFDWASGDFNDTGVFSLSFFGTTDGSGAELGAGFSEQLDDADNFNVVSFHESVGGLVPVGTRSVTLQIDTSRASGSETNLWFDNFTGDIATIPEPASLVLMGLGGLAMIAYRKRV